ncbi:hypothetical protein HYC85_019498 [Camellia sinensis]|uniref:Uncharacterized protein n=1 Tax=Camellia sinensis TaxID=4442 RepID=A0A7J7GQS6_CAMSI|nr:hypothetical protein HYC85_019498 [Camellia sinensis]
MHHNEIIYSPPSQSSFATINIEATTAIRVGSLSRGVTGRVWRTTTRLVAKFI